LRKRSGKSLRKRSGKSLRKRTSKSLRKRSGRRMRGGSSRQLKPKEVVAINREIGEYIKKHLDIIQRQEKPEAEIGKETHTFKLLCTTLDLDFSKVKCSNCKDEIQKIINNRKRIIDAQYRVFMRGVAREIDYELGAEALIKKRAALSAARAADRAAAAVEKNVFTEGLVSLWTSGGDTTKYFSPESDEGKELIDAFGEDLEKYIGNKIPVEVREEHYGSVTPAPGSGSASASVTPTKGFTPGWSRSGMKKQVGKSIFP
jgi:hypothetical protein